ncbi:PEGA domain-containing protein [Thermococcus indicus]|uniref:PEGA domain-containing protein n=1 Tax=Thermococcus indicus TaxID=2586643 RepID=A0A4Y5SL27_9EURY|nr:PEGA domain-containing protein [Thermococcus indicus]QDA31598.1 PEGA domain-containing protein [Thermococcus indicus]
MGGGVWGVVFMKNKKLCAVILFFLAIILSANNVSSASSNLSNYLLWQRDNPAGCAIAMNDQYIAIGQDGWITGGISRIYLVDITGNMLWSYQFQDISYLIDIAISSENNIIVAISQQELVALTPQGKTLYKQSIWGGDYVSVDTTSYGEYTVVGTGIMADTNEGPKQWGEIYLVSSSGSITWKKTIDGKSITAVAISDDGSYIVAGTGCLSGTGEISSSQCGEIYILDKSGNIINQYITSANVDSIDISPDGKYISVGLTNGDLLILDRSTLLLVGEYHYSSSIHSVSISGPPYKIAATFFTSVVILDIRGNELLKGDVGRGPVYVAITKNGNNLAVINEEELQMYTIIPPHITVRSYPSGAEVYLNGRLIGQTPIENYQVDPGTYEVKIIKEGYQDYTTTVTLDAGESKTISATLTPTFGYLTIYSSPSGAEVYLNGTYIGTTPVENHKLDVGTYEIEIKKESYSQYTQKVTINPGETTTLNVNLNELPASLRIESTPSGAEVYINGDYYGTTPIETTLSAGTYTIRITKQDYEDYTTKITLEAGGEKKLTATLTPKFGYLTVTSSPSGAEVYVDSNYIGTTPLEDYKLSTGEHSVVVKKNDYQDYETTVTIEPGKTEKLEVTLSKEPGTLKITSEPSGAKVYIGGDYKGTTPLTLNLAPGTYDVKLTMKDYEDYTTTVTLSPGETKSLSATLKPAYGYLSVESDPSGAEVYVDGNYIGTTPITDYKLSPGEHSIRIKKDGYEEYTKTVSVEAGKSVSVSAGLVAIQTIQETTTTHSETVYSQTKQSSPTEAGRTDGGLNPTYLIAALIGLIAVGGIAAKAKGGKPKPSPLAERAVTPAPAKKPAPKPASNPVPYFPPELLDKYEPLEFLGEGGFAKVFKVKRKSDGKVIALKVSRLDEKAKRFFLKEVKAWRLLDHKNIVKLYNAFDEPLPHLEIEFVDGIEINGEVIRDLGKYPKPVDEEKALSFIRGIAEGLKHAHGKQVYHRDLKPQNVLITSDLTPKITDWGLAKVGAVSTTATTTKGLTLLYAAPEQLDDETYGHTDQRTDIYQLGLIFYELLTGKLPYQGTSPAVVMAKVINPAVKPKPPSHFNRALAKYDGIFEKLLAKRKGDRYGSVEEFLRDLELMKKLDEERKALEKEIERTKTTMSMTTDSRELKKLMRQLVEQLSRNALLHAQLNDKAGLINALEDLRAFTKEHKDEIENAISQFELMMRESVPISKSTLDELRVLLHKVQREVEG